MSTIFILGAGASRGYPKSRTGIYPPLANNFFSTFSNLLISRDFEVKIGNIINYIRDSRGVPVERQPVDFDENIESVFAELDTELRKVWSVKKGRKLSSEQVAARFSLSKAYDQFIFWFAHVLNEVQNGDVCPIYSKLLEQVTPDDLVLSFNWDTILDRALYETDKWFPDDGYGVQFDGLLHNSWRKPRSTTSSYLLLKLHGSTNWFGPYVTRNLMTGERQWLATTDTVHHQWCFVDGQTRFETYKDRWRPGYSPFSYFFPPNDPIQGQPLMPVLIPPTDVKLFNEYSSIFRPLWNTAHSRIRDAERIVIIGYSFPPTDLHALELLDSFVERPGYKRIEIIDPFGETIRDRIWARLGARTKLQLHKRKLSDHLGLDVPTLRATDSEVARIDSEEGEQIRTTEFPGQEMDSGRKQYLLDLLSYLSIHGQSFDLTTYSGNRFIGCKLVGEFATHMYGAYRADTFAYRTNNILIKPDIEPQCTVELDDIWIVNPLPATGISKEQLENVDLSGAKSELREMIRTSFHCKDEDETDYFLRRYLAS